LNIKEYISSGILESYALGELTEVERVEVEINLVQFSELREELTIIEQTSESLMMRLAIEPPVQMKEKVIVAIRPKSKTVQLDIADEKRWKFAAAASIAVALVASYLAYDYYSRWKNSELALNDLIAQNKQIAQDYNRVNLRLDKVESDLHIIDNPAFTKVVMNGTPNAPRAMASVYWNEQSKEVFISIQNLRELSQQNQYQLWAIIDGKPVDAGVFDGNSAGLKKMKDIGKGAKTFAVTIEPRGGKASPTLETMQVAGTVTKG
jgi:anti-sigma-K factor RskA